MLIVSAILLAAVAMFAVAYPIVLRSRSARPAAVSAQEALDELLAQRDATFQALRELNFDHRVGKITDGDFVAFEAHLKQAAANSLRALDGMETEIDEELDRVIEHTVRQRHAALVAGGRPCPACGKPASPEDKFCAACGAALPAETAPAKAAAATQACPGCGQPYQPGDLFCAKCGRALPS